MTDYWTNAGTSLDGRYVVQKRGDRYGTLLDISVDGELCLTVWVRKAHRAVLQHEQELANKAGAEAVAEWIVDNGASEGKWPLLTLSHPIGLTTLGDLLQAFFEADEETERQWAQGAGKPWPPRIVRVCCRGNQRVMMEERYG